MPPKTKGPKKASPYTLFFQWLDQPFTAGPLPDDVKKGLSVRAIMAQFGAVGDVTVFINETFNNYELMLINDQEFYDFIKTLWKRFKLTRRDTTFFAADKKNAEVEKVHRALPYFKRYEIVQFLELIKDDPDFEEYIDSIIPDAKKKKRRTKKKTKKIDTSKLVKKSDKKIEKLTFDKLREYMLDG